MSTDNKNNKNNKEDKLKKLKNLEEEKSQKLKADSVKLEETKVEIRTESELEQPEPKEKIKVSALDGFRQIDKTKMPNAGKFYPPSWEFYYRCPTTDEVANFSTFDEEDRIGIIKAVTDLIVKCFTIVDTDLESSIPSDNINDGERLYFFLLLREYYLYDAPIKYNIIDDDNEVLNIQFVADSLVYPEIKQGLFDNFDGRMFKFVYDNPESKEQEFIQFLIPTLKTSSRIIKYMETLHKKVSDQNKDGIKKEDFNKQFLAFVPFLYETGTESVMSLRKKYQQLMTDKIKYRNFVTIVTKLTPLLTNEEVIKYYKVDDNGNKIDDEEGRCLMKFPGGWKNMFSNDTEFSNIF